MSAISDIKIDDVNETVISGDSERNLIGELQPRPIIISPPTAAPRQQKKKCVKKVVKKVPKGTILKTDTKAVADAKTDVAKYGHRLSITGKAMIGVGAAGALVSLWQMFGARMIAHKILTHGGHHGHHGHRGLHGHDGGHHNWHPHHGDHHRHNGGGDHHRGGRDEDHWMSRNEYALIDNFRIMGFFMLWAFIAISITGCRALRAVKKGDSKFSDLVWKKSFFRLAWVGVLCVIIHHFG